MKLSTKGRYAVTAMLDLAINAEENRRVTLADISELQGISLSYLEQLFARLRRAELVKGTRGPGGGYRLAREASAISVAEILTAVDEKVDMTGCGGEATCKNGQPCLTHELWNSLSQDIYNFLNGITLGELVKRQIDDSSANTAENVSHVTWSREANNTVATA